MQQLLRSRDSLHASPGAGLGVARYDLPYPPAAISLRHPVNARLLARRP